MDNDPPHVVLRHSLEKPLILKGSNATVEYEHSLEEIRFLLQFAETPHVHFCLNFDGQFSQTGFTLWDTDNNDYSYFVDCPSGECECDRKVDYVKMPSPNFGLAWPISRMATFDGRDFEISMSVMTLTLREYHSSTTLCMIFCMMRIF